MNNHTITTHQKMNLLKCDEIYVCVFDLRQGMYHLNYCGHMICEKTATILVDYFCILRKLYHIKTNIDFYSYKPFF